MSLIDIHPTDKPTDAKWTKFVGQEDLLDLEEFTNFQIDFDKLCFHELKPTMILETSDVVERLGIHPKFFQIKSNFFNFCVAIDTSSLEEVRYFFILFLEPIQQKFWQIFHWYINNLFLS